MTIKRRDFLMGAGGALAVVNSAGGAETPEATAAVAAKDKWPELVRPPFRVGFERIFDPSDGESEAWYINDHAFIQASDGAWHVFGITHREPADPDHETFLLHATARDLHGPWKKLAPVMHIDATQGETLIWAPHIISHAGRYWMFYCAGGNEHTAFHIHLATSPDLATWTRHPGNPMVVDGYDARDPMVVRIGDQWILYYCATEKPEGGHHVVKAATSQDLIHWSGQRVVFQSPKVGTYGGPTESPFVVAAKGRYYLFVCSNEPYNDTAVYVSDTPFSWDSANVIMRFGAHAAEVIHDSKDRWFVSSVGWGQGGLYLAELHWYQP